MTARLLAWLLFALLPLSAGIQAVHPFTIPRLPLSNGDAWSPIDCPLDAANKKCGTILQIPKTGTISKVRFRTGWVGTGTTLEVRLETVSASTGHPTGTLWGTNTSAVQTIQDTDAYTNFVTTLVGGASVTRGDVLAVVMANPAAGAGNLWLVADNDFWQQNGGFPYPAFYNGTSWGKSGAPMALALEYSDGSYEVIEGIIPVGGNNSAWFSNSSSPNVRGLRFKLPVKMRVRGGWINGYQQAGGTFQAKLISGGATTLASLTWDADHLYTNDQGDIIQLLFSSSVELEANTYYRLVVQPLASQVFILHDFVVAAEAVMAATPGGAGFHYTEATNPAQESDWTQTLTKQPIMGLIIDGIDMPSGGGGAGMPTVICY